MFDLLQFGDLARHLLLAGGELVDVTRDLFLPSREVVDVSTNLFLAGNELIDISRDLLLSGGSLGVARGYAGPCRCVHRRVRRSTRLRCEWQTAIVTRSR